jgi:hypothetical protein
MPLITAPEKLEGFSLTTIDFEDFAALDGEDLFGNPSLRARGVWFGFCQFAASANINSNSRGVALKVIQDPTDYGSGRFVRSAWILLTEPQLAFGIFYQARDSSLVRVRWLNKDISTEQQYSMDELVGVDSGYIGLVHSSADIEYVKIEFEYVSEAAAKASQIYLDDISYATSFLRRNRALLEGLAWAFVILVGGILITPVGPLCIVCAAPIPAGMVRLIGLLTLALGAFGFAFLRFPSSASRAGRI